MNYELERVWNESVVPYFKVSSWHLFGEIEENCVNVSHDSWSLGQNINLLPTTSLIGSIVYSLWLVAAVGS